MLHEALDARQVTEQNPRNLSAKYMKLAAIISSKHKGKTASRFNAVEKSKTRIKYKCWTSANFPDLATQIFNKKKHIFNGTPRVMQYLVVLTNIWFVDLGHFGSKFLHWEVTRIVFLLS